MYSKYSKFSFLGVRDNDDIILICVVKIYFNNYDKGVFYSIYFFLIYIICVNFVVLFYFNMYFNYYLKFSSVG